MRKASPVGVAWALALVSVVVTSACRRPRQEEPQGDRVSQVEAKQVKPVVDSGCPQMRGDACAHGDAQPAPAHSHERTARYGQALDEGGQALRVDLEQMLKRPGIYHGQEVLLSGVVERACSRRGCWMELSPKEGTPGCRVTFKNYGFLIPTDSAGKRARLRGTVEVTEVTAAAVAHYESEGARFPGKREDGVAQEVRIVATGVELSDS